MTNRLRQIFEVSRDDRPTLRSLEGLRGVAVFLVFLVHYCGQVVAYLPADSIAARISNCLYNIGPIGVDLFFVLSGYLIYGTLVKKEVPFSKYIVKRIRRIYPTFLFVLAIYVLLSILIPSENKFPAGWANQTIYLVQNVLLLPGIFDIPPIITVSWSLSYELFYYLLIPLIIAVLSLRKWNWQRRVVFFLAASAVGFTYFYFFPGPARLLMFVSGIVLFDVASYGKTKIPDFSGLAAFLTALIAATIIFSFHIQELWLYLTLYVLFFLFVLEALLNQNGSARVLSLTPLRWLGNISYSYYLIHGLTLKAAFLLLKKFLPPDGSDASAFWLLLAPMFAATFVVSALLFVFVEKPFSLTVSQLPKQAKTEKPVIPAYSESI